jgi:hypothetical protein
MQFGPKSKAKQLAAQADFISSAGFPVAPPPCREGANTDICAKLMLKIIQYTYPSFSGGLDASSYATVKDTNLSKLRKDASLCCTAFFGCCILGCWSPWLRLNLPRMQPTSHWAGMNWACTV